MLVASAAQRRISGIVSLHRFISWFWRVVCFLGALLRSAMGKLGLLIEVELHAGGATD